LPTCRHPADSEDHQNGCSPQTGFDCSGFARFVLLRCGLAVPDHLRHASQLFDSYGVYSHLARPGDLVFFSHRGTAPTHMGIVVDDHHYIHSSGIDGDRVSLADLTFSDIPLTRANQLYLHNPIGYKVPLVNGGRWNSILPP